ncbi:MAG: aminoglycoside phosphotransferase [Micavibrio sp.]|nr:MAG: aminoglycoside phosphotransferase [Micavibrio sp.]
MDASAVEDKQQIHDFIRIGQWLNDIGLKAPEIYEADEAQGFLLLEDFGDVSFRKAIEKGQDVGALYQLADDVLEHLKVQDCPLSLPDYYSSAIHEKRRFVVDYYIPAVRGEENPQGLVEDYLSVWDGIEKSLPPCPTGFVHADYHLENMMWLPGEEGVKRLGLLDFQEALSGPVAYDLVNLLEDARVAVPDDIKNEILGRQDALVRSWYRILGTQFHCRVIGLFIKLAQEDGKTQYLQHVPRLGAYIKKGLEDPLLAPMKRWFKDQKISFDADEVARALGQE